MASNAPLPMAEAKVVVCDFGTTDWRDAVTFDPIMLPLEDFGVTDVFHGPLMDLMSAVIETETAAFNINGSPVYGLVWSTSGDPVRGVCPVCDDTFTVSEGAPGDELNEGYQAITCGCWDEDPEIDFSDDNDDEVDFSDR